MITLMESRDLDEMIPGNDIDRIHGSDREECAYDKDDITQCQEMIRNA